MISRAGINCKWRGAVDMRPTFPHHPKLPCFWIRTRHRDYPTRLDRAGELGQHLFEALKVLDYVP